MVHITSGPSSILVRRCVIAVVSVIGLAGCGDSSPPAAAPGCQHVEPSQWAVPANAVQAPLHVEVPQPSGWQNSAELVGQLMSLLADQASEATPIVAVVVVGPAPSDDGRIPTFAALVFDVASNRGSQGAEADLVNEVNDVADALASRGTQVRDQLATTLCDYPARSYVSVDADTPEHPSPAVAYNIRSVVVVNDQPYEVQIAYSHYESANAELRTPKRLHHHAQRLEDRHPCRRLS
jgi:hypothetical protein